MYHANCCLCTRSCNHTSSIHSYCFQHRDMGSQQDYRTSQQQYVAQPSVQDQLTKIIGLLEQLLKDKK